MTVEITKRMQASIDTAKALKEEKGIVFPSNPTPKNIQAMGEEEGKEAIMVLVTALLGTVHKMVFKKKPVKAVNVSEAIKVTEVMLGQMNKWTKKQVSTVFTGLPLYQEQRHKWKGDKSVFPTFAKAWNETRDPKKCSELLGENDWGEPFMTPEYIQTRYDMYKDAPENGLKEQIAGTEVGKGSGDSGGRGRKEFKLSADISEAIGLKIQEKLAELDD